ncbi:MAG: copper resistance protein NlpE N-terminal domain-containing protein [Ignavibacteria bacterium]|nr:copper resistance protein NlpE N-terminal domain-containing protein [Ignavibacteria bacterium]
MKIILITVMIFLFISGCRKEEVNNGAVVQISGSYNGIIPCADCEGINYELELKEDFTYRERMIYLGKQVRPFTLTGKWKLEGINKVILYKQSDEMSQFEFSKGDLIMLDGSGERIEGPMADKFILRPGGVQLPGDPYSDTTSTTSDSASKKLIHRKRLCQV